MKILHALIILGLTAYHSLAFAANYLEITRLMIKTGITDVEVVRHNSRVYDSILESIAHTIKNKKLTNEQRQVSVLNQLANLKKRLENQLGSVGNGLSPLLATELTEQFKIANDFAKGMSFVELQKQVEAAREQVKRFRNI